MSRHWRVRLVIAALLVLAGGSGGYAFAHVDALAAISGVTLEPSATPDLLDAIDERGRTGWECRPEKAAQAADARNAQLPQSPDR